jgi:predicted RNA-binding protein YlxR (DUF448 family)
MNEGVKVLIERMKTNPEDFQIHPIPQGVKRGRFYWITEEMQKYLNIQSGHYYMTLLKKDDLDALVDAFKDMHQQELTDKVMRDLFKEEEDLKVSPQIAGGWLPQGGRVSTALGQQNAQNAQNAMWSDPRIAYLSQQQQAQNQHLRAHMDATSGLTNVSNGGTGKTATTGLLGGLTGLFK